MRAAGSGRDKPRCSRLASELGSLVANNTPHHFLCIEASIFTRLVEVADAVCIHGVKCATTVEEVAEAERSMIGVSSTSTLRWASRPFHGQQRARGDHGVHACQHNRMRDTKTDLRLQILQKLDDMGTARASMAQPWIGITRDRRDRSPSRAGGCAHPEDQSGSNPWWRGDRPDAAPARPASRRTQP